LHGNPVDAAALLRFHFNPMLDGYGWRTCFVETDERLLDVLMGKTVTQEGQ
jgi:hypothetical protein